MSAADVSPISLGAGGGPWDRVVSSSGTWTRAEFQGLPLVDRVRLLSSGDLRFYSGAQEVTPGTAMRR